MPPAARRRSSLAVAASALAHLVVLAIALAQHPTIPVPDQPEVPSPDTITVQLMRRPPAATSSRPAPLRLHRTPQAPAAPGLPIAPVRAVPTGAPAPPTAPPGPAAPRVEAGPDLRPGLRHGAAGCANAAAVGMSRAERDLCDERLGRNISREPFLPAPIEGRIRAYYDAVAEAKKPDPLPVPLRATGKLGVWDTQDWATSGHGPAIGCRLYFGVGKKPNPMPHALKLGPCYIEPPKGPLDPEVDITPP